MKKCAYKRIIICLIIAFSVLYLVSCGSAANNTSSEVDRIKEEISKITTSAIGYDTLDAIKTIEDEYNLLSSADQARVDNYSRLEEFRKEVENAMSDIKASQEKENEKKASSPDSNQSKSSKKSSTPKSNQKPSTSSKRTCPNCNGTGMTKTYFTDDPLEEPTYIECPMCRGTGKVSD